MTPCMSLGTFFLTLGLSFSPSEGISVTSHSKAL